MKPRLILLGALVILAALIPLGVWAQESYAPKANEEFYGTWTNEKMDNQKTVTSPGMFKDYAKTTDTDPIQEGAEQIYSKWTDSEGNIWYKTFGMVMSGKYTGVHFQTLSKINKSGTVREFAIVVPVYHFDPLNYPPAPYPWDPTYHIYNRSAKYVPTANEELYGAWQSRLNAADYKHPQNSVITADGYKSYLHTSDTVPQEEGTMVIDSKWTDSEGNVWYKILGTVTTGQWKGYNFQLLEKLSKSATVKESTIQPIGFGWEFSPKYYPTKVDPNSPTYEIRYREGS